MRHGSSMFSMVLVAASTTAIASELQPLAFSIQCTPCVNLGTEFASTCGLILESRDGDVWKSEVDGHYKFRFDPTSSISTKVTQDRCEQAVSHAVSYSRQIYRSEEILNQYFVVIEESENVSRWENSPYMRRVCDTATSININDGFGGPSLFSENPERKVTIEWSCSGIESICVDPSFRFKFEQLVELDCNLVKFIVQKQQGRKLIRR